jgi:prepilin-type processing-associated H-X9-DG protein
MLYSGSKLRLSDAKDGTTNVFLVGETRYGGAAWAASAKQDACAFTRILAGAQEQINLHAGTGIHESRGFSSDHPGGANFLMADGSVHFVRETIDLNTYRQLGRRSDRLPTGGFSQ